jgi:hypothetical protein
VENATNSDISEGLTRRDLLKTTGQIAAVSALAGIALPQHVYAGESGTINIALVGCGGRGTGAAQNALSTKVGPVKLTAMADAYSDRLKGSHESLKNDKKASTPIRMPWIV